MGVDDRQVLDSCRNLWEVTLGLDLEDGACATDSDEESLKSYVNLSGDFEGAVVVECTESIMRHAAAMMFGTDTEKVSAQDLQDSLNELARLVGKSIQRTMPGTGKVSAPRPATGNTIPSMRPVTDWKLSCEGRPVRIYLLEREAITA